MRTEPTVLVCAEHYLPGYRAGGPIRSISALVEGLADTFDFRILTSDRDHGTDEPYDDISYGRWHEIGSARVRYLSPAERRFPSVFGLLGDLEFDALYVNSLYSLTFSLPAIIRYRLGLLRAPLVVAPKGQLAPSAIAQKRWKKEPYLNVIARSGLYDGVRWRASNETEAERIRAWFGSGVDVTVLPDLTVPPPALDTSRREPTGSGRVHMVFLSRIHPVKNLEFALGALHEVDGEVTFDIYGPVDDEEYWKQCQRRIEGLPDNVEVKYRGPVAPTKVVETMADYDLFVLPTRGENFGHVIVEAMAAGTPVLISDRTRWTDLREEGVGWAESLDSRNAFAERIEAAVEADPETLAGWGRRARNFAESEMTDEESVERSRQFFRQVIESRG